jgi:hypothetical protein
MSESRDNAKRLNIGAVAEAVAVTVAVGFVLSVIYDWGFITALGITFSFLPSSTADHFRSGLIWLPPLLAILTAYVAIEFQFRRVEHGLTEEEIIAASKNPTRLRRFRQGPAKVLFWIAPLGLLNYLLIGDAAASGLPLALSLAWVAFAEWTYSPPLVKQRRPAWLQACFTFLPVIGIVAYFSGYNAALDAANRKPVEVTILGEESVQQTAKMLRTFEKGVLVLTERGAVEFISWDQVHAIRNNAPYAPFRGIVCEWFNKCPERRATK